MPQRARQFWPARTRFVELCVGDGRFGRALRAEGLSRYLGVAKCPRRNEALARRYPDLAEHLATGHGGRPVRSNNADVLILGGWSTRWLWQFRNVRHAGHVAVPVAAHAGFLLGLLFGLVGVLLGRYRRPQLVRCGQGHSSRCWLLVWPVRRRRDNNVARRYIPHELGLEGFLRRLSHQGISHAVLRWFEDLPALPSGEDLDLLVADEHHTGVLALLDEGPGILPCDLYTVSGLPGSDYRKMAYFVPHRAQRLLDEAREFGDLCRVPSPRHQFLSMAYHALYHKGFASGLPEQEGAASRNDDPRYRDTLSALQRTLGWDVPLTLDALDEFLEQQGWRPPQDMLARLARKNAWLRARLESADRGDPHLAVFLVRREVVQRSGLTRVEQLLERHGFSLVATRMLDATQSRRVAANVRGGNWGRGPWSLSGGPPVAVIVAFDSRPIRPTRRQRRRFPLLQNARLLEKDDIRRALNAGYPPEQWCNGIHSADNGREALEYLRLACPELEEVAIRRVAELGCRASDGTKSLRDLTRYGRRASLAQIDYQGSPAVKKTFKPGLERFCRREALAMGQLSRSIRAVPPLLAASESSVIYPYYEDVLRYERSSGKLLPLGVARQAIKTLRAFFDAGYALVDASADNLLVDAEEGLKFFDFEFLYQYPQRPKDFEHSYDIVGVPPDFDGDVPTGGAKRYATHWQPYTGLSLASLLHDPPWLQHVKRVGYQLLRPHRYLPRRIRGEWRAVFRLLRRRGAQLRPVAPSPAPRRRRAA